MRRRFKVPSGMFGSEQELCEAFIHQARAAGFQAHPECNNWDALLVCRETGDQIGVHGKLRPSVDVLAQCLTDISGPGPEVHAVLVPHAGSAFKLVARALKVHVFEGVFVDRLDLAAVLQRAQRWHHPVRDWAPEVELSIPAGVPSPRRVTKWKMAAVKLCLLARKRGYVTSQDLRSLELDPTWWLSERYGQVLERRVVDGIARRGEYELRDSSSPMVPDLRWPEIVDALQKAAEKETEIPQLKGPRLRTRPKPSSTMLPPPTQLKPVATTLPRNSQFSEDMLLASGK